MVIYEQSKPLLKREPIVTDVTERVQRFGLDNLYPQRAEEAAKHSYTLKSVLNVLSDFLNGQGFRNESFASMVVNTEGLAGQTANDFLNDITVDFAKWRTICAHVNYDMNYRIVSIVAVPFVYCRLGQPCGQDLRVKKILYSTNWERDGRRELRFPCIEEYDIFNPDPVVIKQQILEAGGFERWKGQMIFYTPKAHEYPLATFDTVINQAQAQDELGIFDINTLQNRFSAELAVVYPGEFESAEERAEFKKLIENKSGTRRAGSRIGIQDKSGTKKASDIFQVLNQPNTDKLYEATRKNAADAIMECYSMPKELIGMRPETGMFNQDNMENAYTYYNSKTQNDRNYISRFISKVFSYWVIPINDPCDIKPQQYIIDDAAGTDNVNVRDNLANMSGRQAQNMGRIIRQYAQGKLNYEQAKVLLQGGFGLSNEEIDKLLGKNELEPPQTAQVEPGPTAANLWLALKMTDPGQSELALDVFGFKSKDWLK